jgi:hypothetical protein
VEVKIVRTLDWLCHAYWESHRLADEVARMEATDTDKSKCGCLLRSTFGLSCPCSLA